MKNTASRPVGAWVIDEELPIKPIIPPSGPTQWLFQGPRRKQIPATGIDEVTMALPATYMNVGEAMGQAIVELPKQ